MNRLLLLAPVLILAACDRADDAPAAAETPAPSVASPQPTDAAEAKDGTDTGPVAATLPAAFHGTWDALDAPCDPVTDARLTLSASEARFYETTGTVKRVEIDSPTRVTVSFAMSGEGENWSRAEVFELTENGTRLVARDPSGEDQTVITRKRCS